MTLSCSCDYEVDYDGFFWETPHDTIMSFGRRKRCCSCKGLIAVYSTGLIFPRHRSARDDIEDRIYGEDPVEMAPWFMCEPCGDLFWSLDQFGYCITLGDNMHVLVAEYAEQQIEYTKLKKEYRNNAPR